MKFSDIASYVDLPTGIEVRIIPKESAELNGRRTDIVYESDDDVKAMGRLIESDQTETEYTFYAYDYKSGQTLKEKKFTVRDLYEMDVVRIGSSKVLEEYIEVLLHE